MRSARQPPRRRSAHIIGKTARILVVQIHNQPFCSLLDFDVMIAPLHFRAQQLQTLNTELGTYIARARHDTYHITVNINYDDWNSRCHVCRHASSPTRVFKRGLRALLYRTKMPETG